MDHRLLMLMRRRDKAESRMCNAAGSKNRYNNPAIHEYERDVAEELIEEAMEEIWHEDGVDLEEHGVDVKSGDSSSTSGDSE